MQTNRRWLALLVPLGLALLLAACGPSEARQDEEAAAANTSASNTATTNESAEASEGTERARQVRTLTAEEGTLRATRSTSVTINPLQESRVSSSATGRLQRIYVREGSQVEAGEVIMQLEDDNPRSQLRNAELAVESARINLQSAQRATGESNNQLSAQLESARQNYDLLENQYHEAQALHQAGGISSTELKNLESQVSQARSALIQAQDALARSQRAPGEDLALLQVQLRQAEAQLQQARDAYNETRIKAPFSGEIAEVFVEEGEFVAAGNPAFRLVSTDRQQARFQVSPEDAQRLAEQGTIYIRYDGLDYASFIIRRSGAPGAQRLVDVTAEIYPSDSPIPNGTVAQLRYQVDLARGILLPSGAISAEGGDNLVYAVQDGRAQGISVDVIAEAGGEAAVRGLDAGARVIYPRPSDIRSGMAVSVVERE